MFRITILLIIILFSISTDAQTLLPFSSGSAPIAGPIIPSNRLITWSPGVTYNGGIPNRTTQCGAALSPIGGSSDDTAQINAKLVTCAALANSGSPQVVLLNAGKYNINGNGISWPIFSPGGGSYLTLRGGGSLPAAMATGGNLANDNLSALNYVSGTWLVKADRNSNTNYGILYIGRGPDRIFTQLASTNLTVDGAKGSTSITVSSNSGLSVGQLVLLDSNGDTDSNVFWGNRADLSGYFTGSLSSSGNTLTVSAPINGPSGVDGAANVTHSGTSMTVNSTATTGYWPQFGGGGNNPVGTTVFSSGGTYRGSIVSGTYPTFTMSQNNGSLTENVNIGGILPAVNYPIFDSKFSRFYCFIASGTYPNFVCDRSVPTVASGTLGAGGGSRRFFSRQERPVSQLVKITNIASNVITFETPLYYDFTIANQAQLTTIDTSQYPITTAASVENIGLFGGMGGDGQGNLPISLCVSCWVKNVESYWSVGTGIGLYGTYRTEVRDSFMHETPSPNPGGGGYVSGMNQWASDNLFENNIMWNGNKEVVCRTCGGGNVIAYNYMDDAFGGTYPESPEAGVNAAHQTTTLFALMEGNYSQNFEGDAFWGNSIYNTIHRNWLSGIRASSPSGGCPNITPCTNLRTYTSVQGGTTFPYGDYLGRRIVDIQANSYNHNFTGNVLGFNGQSLLSHTGGNFNTTQTTWVYEELDSLIANDTNVIIWNIGAQQDPLYFAWVANTYTTQLRSGNWDWNSNSQQWHGIGGSNEYGGNLTAPYPSVPNSYYLTGGASATIPSFFSGSSYNTTTWPWVNPTTGYTSGGAITSGTYNSGTGAVSLTVPSGLAPSVGTTIIVSGLIGTGTNLASINGSWTSTSGTGGTTINFTAASGLGSTTITGGFININGGGLPAMRRFLNNTPNTL